MLQLFAIIRTELQLLWRDKPGLMILFIMPMILVLVLTLLDSAQTDASTTFSMLIINHDSGSVSKNLITGLQDSGYFTVTTVDTNNKNSEALAKQDVADGEYQSLLIIPKNLSHDTATYAKSISDKNISVPETNTIQVYLDPTTPPALKSLIKNVIDTFNLKVQMNTQQQVLKQALRGRANIHNMALLQPNFNYIANDGAAAIPNTVQQHVPAWTLFGMFLIMIPIAGLFVKERDQGILQRLYVAPVGKFAFMFSRALSFVVVNLIQFIFMFSIGIFVLPLFGLPALNVENHIWEILVVAIAVSFAATSFGVLLGTWVKSFEQAMALGPTLIVVAAAVGGIMSPVYLMPEVLKVFSNYSPLNWGQASLVNILVRGYDLHQILPELIKLIIFTIVCLSIAMIRYMRRV